MNMVSHVIRNTDIFFLAIFLVGSKSMLSPSRNRKFTGSLSIVKEHP